MSLTDESCDQSYPYTLPPFTEDDVRSHIQPQGYVTGSHGLVQGSLYTRNSIKLDKYATYTGVGGAAGPLSTRILLLWKYARLAYKLGLSRIPDTVAAIAVDMDKFRTEPSANYDIGGPTFTSIDDGTFWIGDPQTPTNPNGIWPADPRLAKVKSFLRRHLNREPTDKDVDWVIYTYYGSDNFGLEYSSGGMLYYGIQESFYDECGRMKHRNADDFSNLPRIRRTQDRIR